MAYEIELRNTSPGVLSVTYERRWLTLHPGEAGTVWFTGDGEQTITVSREGRHALHQGAGPLTWRPADDPPERTAGVDVVAARVMLDGRKTTGFYHFDDGKWRYGGSRTSPPIPAVQWWALHQRS